MPAKARAGARCGAHGGAGPPEAFDTQPFGFAYLDRQKICRFANRRFAAAHGLTPEEIRGKSMDALPGRDVRDLCEPFFAAALAGETQDFIHPARHADGRRMTVRTILRPDVHRGGAVEGMYLCSVNTARPAADEALAACLCEAPEDLRRAGLDEAIPAPGSAPMARPAPGSRGLVLVVDDDAALRGAIRRRLLRAGYRVEEASGTAEALQRLADLPDLRALVSDVVMEGPTGFALAQAASRLRPGLGIVLMSGLEGLAARHIGGAAFPLLRKPFEPEDLVRAIEAVAPPVEGDPSG